VLQHAPRLASKPALIEGVSGRTLTYGQLAEGVRRAGVGLSRRGFRRDSVLAIDSPNLPEYAVAFHAAAALGGVVTTANPLLDVEELAHQLNVAGASWLLTTSHLLDRALGAAGRSRVREIFTFDLAVGATSFAGLFEIEPQLHEAPTEALIDPVNDPVALLYSTGASGLNEGVKRTHYSFVADLCRMAMADLTCEDDVIIGVIPFWRLDGLRLLNYALSCGATIVTLPCFQPETILKAMQDYRITRVLHASPDEDPLRQRPEAAGIRTAPLRATA
jgi:acyl-CoA synthetase (AMP-forming)/AMP-acid ligase II